jgi:hypothetical protein
MFDVCQAGLKEWDPSDTRRNSHGLDAFALFRYETYCSAPVYDMAKKYHRRAVQKDDFITYVGKDPDRATHAYLWKGLAQRDDIDRLDFLTGYAVRGDIHYV